MIRINGEKLVMQSVMGSISHPKANASLPYRISYDGEVMVLPATGGITYNVKIGDLVSGLEGDHVEPGVTIKNNNESENAALNLLSCIGNEAKVINGDARGVKGFVTGTHGGVEHVLVYFKQSDLEKMSIEDRIQIKAYGQGLKLMDYPDIKVMNIDPNLFLRLGIEEKENKLKIPVAAIVPAYMMGSGIGSATAHKGDYDIMTEDRDAVKKHGLDKLKFGDIVMLQDCDTEYGRGYLKGAVTIGVIVHSDCIKMGHGPGVTTIMTCKKSLIDGIIDENANIGKYMNI